jgi:hypothetical protein
LIKTKFRAAIVMIATLPAATVKKPKIAQITPIENMANVIPSWKKA